MNIARVLSRLLPFIGRADGDQPARRYNIIVKELSARHRRRLLRHFLALGPDDRLLRFGGQLPDELVRRYVEGLDFRRDQIFGVFDPGFRLVGVAHLAFIPIDQRALYSHSTTREKVAEFGVSVSATARGLGIGTRLFQRAVIHCRNADVDTLYMHCLSSNKTMMHIAVKAGMKIERSYGEADAYLKLPPASPGSVLQEAMDEQLARFDYTFKSNSRRAARWLGYWPGKHEKK